MTSYTARVEWDQYVDPSPTELDEWVDGLADLCGAIGVEQPRQDVGYPATWAATVTLDAGSLRQAVNGALRAVEDALGVRASGVAVLATHEHDRRVEQPSIPELVGYAEVAELAGVSKQRARQLADLPGFPPAVAEPKSGPLRIRSQVEGWLARWERKPGRPKRA